MLSYGDGARNNDPAALQRNLQYVALEKKRQNLYTILFYL